MKPLLLMLLLAAVVPMSAQNRIDMTMMVDAVDREFIVSVPSGPAPAGGYPLVLMFHGSSGEGEIYYNNSGWKEKGEQEKFISVFPTALRYCVVNDSGNQVHITKWSNGNTEDEKCPGVVLGDDVKFVRMMIDTLSGLYPINDARIFATGFSNGSVFVHKLAVELSDVIDAVAGVAGGLHSLDSAAPLRKIPVWFAFGTRDDRFYKPFQPFGITDELPFNDSTLGLMSRSVRRFLGMLDLDTTWTRSQTERAITYRFDTPAGSEPSSIFLFTIIDDMMHVYPNGSNYPISAAEVFWSFFIQSTGTVSVDNPQHTDPAMRIYPNPTTGWLAVEGTGTVTLRLSTLLGQSVFTTTAAAGSRIQLPQLPAGMYVASMASGKNHQQSMIIVR